MTLAEQHEPRLTLDFHGSLRAAVRDAECISLGKREYYGHITLSAIERAASRYERIAFIFTDGSHLDLVGTRRIG